MKTWFLVAFFVWLADLYGMNHCPRVSLGNLVTACTPEEAILQIEVCGEQAIRENIQLLEVLLRVGKGIYCDAWLEIVLAANNALSALEKQSLEKKLPLRACALVALEAYREDREDMDPWGTACVHIHQIMTSHPDHKRQLDHITGIYFPSLTHPITVTHPRTEVTEAELVKLARLGKLICVAELTASNDEHGENNFLDLLSGMKPDRVRTSRDTLVPSPFLGRLAKERCSFEVVDAAPEDLLPLLKAGLVVCASGPVFESTLAQNAVSASSFPPQDKDWAVGIKPGDREGINACGVQ